MTSIHHYKEKVKMLEQEIKTLKVKYDELRKAKTTMVLQQKKEYVETSAPGKHNGASDLKIKQSYSEELDKLKSAHKAELEKLKKELEQVKGKKSVEPCGHEEIIEALQTKLSETESLNTALSLECQQLQEKLTQSYETQSRVEAEHVDKMENMKTELQKKWQAMYQEWMRTTESKIRELQETNDMLKSMLGPKS